MKSSHEPEVEIVQIKGRHYVSLDHFEFVVREVLSPGQELPVHVDRYPQFDMAVCEVGMFQLIGCGPRYVHEPDPPSMLVIVRGLAQLLPALLRDGSQQLSEPSTEPRGVLVKVRLPGGQVAECLEPVTPRTTAVR